ncbi:MAG: BON domain-containing protein [Planctomycetes bacterium]|nr:BON domain-containing protein [Planctomycetota bacterium]
MRKRLRCMLWASGLAAGLGIANLAPGQSGDGPFQKLAGLFGRKDATAEHASSTDGPLRSVEIEIELAWMADAATFPYHLEVRAKGSGLELRGTVPSRKVHDQALNIARLHCALAIMDSIQESPRVAANSVRLAPAQMQSTAQTALREALPKQAKYLHVQCSSDGTAHLTGQVLTAEQKLTASRALRRLHGCACVVNLAQVREQEEGVALNSPRINSANLAPAEKESQKGNRALGAIGKSPDTPSSDNSELVAPRIQTVSQTKPLPNMPPNPDSIKTEIDRAKPAPTKWSIPQANNESRGMLIVGTDEPAQSKPAAKVNSKIIASTAWSAARLKKRIEEACPGAKDVRVTFTSPNEVRVELRARPGDDLGQIAGQILSLRELENLRPDLHIQVPDEKR